MRREGAGIPGQYWDEAHAEHSSQRSRVAFKQEMPVSKAESAPRSHIAEFTPLSRALPWRASVFNSIGHLGRFQRPQNPLVRPRVLPGTRRGSGNKCGRLNSRLKREAKNRSFPKHFSIHVGENRHLKRCECLICLIIGLHWLLMFGRESGVG